MTVPRCAARRRDGRDCGALASSPTAIFCRHHEELAAELGEEAVRAGNYPRRRRPREETPLVVEPIPSAETVPPKANGRVISPAEVRPRLAQVTADSHVEIEQALLEAALGATKEQWTTFTCPDCGKKHRAQVAVPDVRARTDAIGLLLREGLGRAPQAEEPPVIRMPESIEEIENMSWPEMQAVAAALLLDAKTGLRERVASLSENERRLLRDLLAEAPA
jgi:hypothetical protein